MNQVTIIVPVYNTEKYIERCVTSLINQTFKEIDIILVDDGSNDLSPVICDKLQSKYNNIQVIHKANGGVSSARNAGLDVVKTEFVMFCDADDTYEPEMVKTLYEAITENECELAIISRFNKVLNGKLMPDNATHFDGLIDSSLYAEALLYPIADNFVLPKGCVVGIFKNSVIQKNSIRFIENLAFGEDSTFNLQYALKIKKVFAVNKALYNYYMVETSATHADVDAMLSKAFLRTKTVNDLLEHEQKCEKLIAMNNASILLVFLLYIRCAVCSKNCNKIKKSQLVKAELKQPEIRQWLKQTKSSFYKGKNKLLFILLKFKLTLPLVIYYQKIYNRIGNN